MMKVILRISSTFVMASALLGALPVAAEGPLGGSLSKLDQTNQKTNLEWNLASSVGNVVKSVLALTGTIFFILTIYAGILWMTSMGNGEQVEKSRSIVTAAIIGLAITLSAYAITYFVGSRLNTSTNPGISAPASK